MSLPREVGNGVHSALQIYYSPDTPFETEAAEWAMAAFFDSLREQHDVDQQEEIKKAEALANVMLEGYWDWIAETGADVGLRVDATEINVDIPLRGYLLSAKMDARLYDEHTEGHKYMDHKTVGSFDQITKLLTMNEQGQNYQLIDVLTRDEGERVDGGIFNMIKRVKRTARAEPPFFDRVEINHSNQTIESFLIRVEGYIDEISRLEAALDAGGDHRFVCPPSPNDTCVWSCSFISVCTLFDSDPAAAEDKLRAYYQDYDPYERYGVNVADAVTNEGSNPGT